MKSYDTDITTPVKYWDWLTTFFDYLSDEDRELFENFWNGLTTSGNVLIKKANRLLNTSAPEHSSENLWEDFYEIQVGPFHSKPVILDPTLTGQNYLIRPISKILIEPQYENDINPVYHDAIEITASDYYKIRSIGLECYVVVKVKNDSIPDRYFKVFNLLSSEEATERAEYAEVDVSVNDDDTSDLIGRIAFESKVSYSISNFNVSFIDDVSSPVATWGSTSLVINTNGQSVESIITAANIYNSNSWATLSNKSGYNTIDGVLVRKQVAPVFQTSPIKFHDLPNFRYWSTDSGRHYPGSGMVWKWFDGLNNSSPDASSHIGNSYYGEYIEDRSKNKYIVVVDGDLSYIGDNPFSIYFTTGRAYDIDSWVIYLPQLHTHITDGYPIEFKLDADYSVSDNIVEFKHDIVASGEVSSEDILYCKKAEIIEHFLYEMFGNLVGIPDWSIYNHNNFSGKAAINSALLSLQNVSSRQDYQRALNAYYGLPIAPQNSKVIGLYESYGYKISSIRGTGVTLELKPGSELHQFVQDGGRFFIEDKPDAIIFSVTNRLTGEIQMKDASFLAVGDEMHIKLRNRFILRDIYAETVDDAAYITIYSPEGHAAIQHLIDVTNTLSNGKSWPEILIYDTEKLEHNYNGIYHITFAEPFGGNGKMAKLTLYKKPSNGEPLYNDYVGGDGIQETDISARHGSVHIPWPTHKFLYLLMENNEYFKAYLDAPIDTIFDDEDSVEQYQILARNVSILTKEMFMKWVQFDNFKRYNGINLESDSLEVIRALPGAIFGNYFPSSYVETK